MRRVFFFIRKKMSPAKYAQILASSIILISCLNVYAANDSVQALGESGKKPYVYMGGGTIRMPIGYFFLIRKDNNLCAIRFTNDGTSESAFIESAGIVVGKYTAEYDYFNQYDGSGDLKKKNVDSGHVKLHKQAADAMVSGLSEIKCGSLALSWHSGITVNMFQGKFWHDDGIKFAPTKWRDISEVDADDPNLEWFGLGDEELRRGSILIYVENL